jgi:hypothetical protein
MGTYGIEDSDDWQSIIQNSTRVDELPPYCTKLNINADKEQLVNSFYKLFEDLGYTYDEFIEIEKERSLSIRKTMQPHATEAIAWDMNFNHMPHLTGKDRWDKHRGTFEMIFKEGVNPADYSTVLSELDNTYLGSIIRQVFDDYEKTYNKPFRGRANIIWINANKGYNFHFDDPRTPVRYHIPLITNDDALWIFRDVNDSEKFYTMNMPCGTVWKFFPVMIDHTVRNMGNRERAHLIITEVNDA